MALFEQNEKGNQSVGDGTASGLNRSDYHPSRAELIDMIRKLGVPVIDIYPPANWRETPVLTISFFYGLLFVVGCTGNLFVLTLIRRVRAHYDNTMIYVMCLCLVDLVSMIPLPMTIVDQLLGFWPFGTPVCKLYRLMEHVGKTLSTFILAAMASDRCLGVCRPFNPSVRSRIAVIITLCTLSLLTLLLLAPLLVAASSKEILIDLEARGNPYRLLRVRIFKCVDNLHGTMFTVFMLYIFTLGFAIPVILIALFYGIMLRKLYSRTKRMPASHLPVNRIALYTMAIALFHIVCWTPYWSATLYSLYLDIFNVEPTEVTSHTFVLVMYGVHALPYVNSALNWLFYGMLNRQLQRRTAFGRNGTNSYRNNSVSMLRKASNYSYNHYYSNNKEEKLSLQTHPRSSSGLKNNGCEMCECQVDFQYNEPKTKIQLPSRPATVSGERYRTRVFSR